MIIEKNELFTVLDSYPTGLQKIIKVYAILIKNSDPSSEQLLLIESSQNYFFDFI